MRDLDSLRIEIDEVDKNLLELLAVRSQLVKEVWKYKKANEMIIYQPERWKKVLESRKAIAKELGLKEDFIENIWNEIHNYSLEIEKK